MQKPNMFEAKKRDRKAIIKEEYKTDPKYKNIGNGLKYTVKTYGCQMNEHDSENIKAMLEEMSFTEEEDYEKADLVILNTCAIRENAHNKVFGLLGRLKHQKEENPNLIIGLCGCMAQEESVVEELSSKYKFVDIIFGTHNIHELPSILNKSLLKHAQEIEVYSIEGNLVENMPVRRDSKYKAWVNIMYGCDKFCTYCIVPYTRGRQRSRMPEDILNEVKKLKEDNYQYLGDYYFEMGYLVCNSTIKPKVTDGKCELANENDKEILTKFMYENLENFGKDCAIDGKFLDTYARQFRKNRCNDNRSEHDATSSCKTYYMKDGTTKKEWHYGFRAHIICDAKYGLPIKSKVTPANNSEQTELDNLLKEMEKMIKNNIN